MSSSCGTHNNLCFHNFEFNICGVSGDLIRDSSWEKEYFFLLDFCRKCIPWIVNFGDFLMLEFMVINLMEYIIY
jgi:hypothetical protein